MTSTRSILVVAVLVAALAGVAGTALAVGQDANAPGNESISVTGSGDVSVAPDSAVVQLTVGASGTNASSVGETVAADATDLRAALADLGIPDDGVRSVGYDVHSDREPREPGSEPGAQYAARQRFEVTLDNVDRVGEVIDTAVANGADEVHGVRFTLSDDARAAARDEALRNAVTNARDEATLLADATGLELDGVSAVSSTGTNVRPYRLDAAAVAGDGGASTDVDTQDVTVSATVHVVYAAG
jgi:uncharacterized protein YggE